MQTWTEKLKKRALALLLLTITLLFWNLYDRYEQASPAPLLENPTLSEAAKTRGSCSETNRTFILTVEEGRHAQLRFHLPPQVLQYELIRVEACMETRQVVEGKHPWNRARIILQQFNNKNRWMGGEHGIGSAIGTSRRTRYQHEIPRLSNAHHIDVVLEQTGQSGSALFDSIRVYPVNIRPSYRYWHTLFVLLWIGAAVIYFTRCRLHTRKLRHLIILNTLIILTGTLIPSTWIHASVKETKQLADRLLVDDSIQAADSDNATPTPPALKKAIADKPVPRRKIELRPLSSLHSLGHYLLFSSLCFLVYLSAALEKQHPSYYAKVAFDILLFAAITEALQFLTVDRTAKISDWLIDLLGMLSAFVLFLLLQLLVRGIKKGRLADALFHLFNITRQR
jgi:VanZ family protein